MTKDQYELDVKKTINVVLTNEYSTREAARVLGLSKSTVHNRITKLCKIYYPEKYRDIRRLMDCNKIRGPINGAYKRHHPDSNIMNKYFNPST